MPGPRFCRLVPLLPVYGGAVAAALGLSAASSPPAALSPLVPVPQGSPSRDVIVGTQTAIALSPHSDLFEFGGAGV